MTTEQLEANGIKDFQLHYAMETLERLGGKTMKLADRNAKPSARN